MNGRLRRAAACGGLRRPEATACGRLRLRLRPPFATLPLATLPPATLPSAPPPARVDGFIAINAQPAAARRSELHTSPVREGHIT